MSYENTQCPCGGKKLIETMLCVECEQSLGGSFDRRRMEDPTASWEDRRASAIRLLTVARKRQAALPLAYSLR
jgi:hypothetical protein